MTSVGEVVGIEVVEEVSELVKDGLFIVVIGGIGSIEGPIIGAILYYVLREYFKDYKTWYVIGSGLAAMIAALYLQPGIWGYLRRRFNIDLFPVRRHLVRSTDSSDEVAAS